MNHRPRFPILLGSTIIFLAVFASEIQATPANSENALRPEKLAEMDAAINQAITDKKCPGGVLWLEHRGLSYHKAYGNRAFVPQVEPMTEDTIFDAASLTKVRSEERRVGKECRSR